MKKPWLYLISYLKKNTGSYKVLEVFLAISNHFLPKLKQLDKTRNENTILLGNFILLQTQEK